MGYRYALLKGAPMDAAELRELGRRLRERRAAEA